MPLPPIANSLRARRFVPALICGYLFVSLLFLKGRGADPRTLAYGFALVLFTAALTHFSLRRLPSAIASAPPRAGEDSPPVGHGECHPSCIRIIDRAGAWSGRHKHLRDLLGGWVSLLQEELDCLSVEACFYYRYTETVERVLSPGGVSIELGNERLRLLARAGEPVHEEAGDGCRRLYLPIPLIPEEGKEVAAEDGERRAWGVLAVTSAAPLAAVEMTRLKLAVVALAREADLYERRRYEKNLAAAFAQVNRMGLHAQSVADVPQLFRLMTASRLVRVLFDGAALWLHSAGQSPDPGRSWFTDNLRPFNYLNLVKEPLGEKPVELYDLALEGCHSVIFCPIVKGRVFFGVLGFFKNYRRFLRPEERVAALLMAQQAAFNLESVILHENLARQNLELKYQKDFAERIFASLNSGIIVVDEQGKVLKANAYTVSILGYDAAEMIGGDLDRQVPGLLDAAVAGKQEGQFTLANGKTLYLGFGLSRIQDSERHLGKIILFRDISEIMNLREQLRRKEYFSTIGEMASWIAHEVRNPVFAIASIARILQKQARDGDQERFIASILKETESLNLLVDDLLMYGKPVVLNLQTLNLPEFVAEVCDGLRSLATETGAEIRSLFPGQEILVNFDPDRMKQVLYNLIKNALDAGAGEITLSVEQDRDFTRLTLRDNGRGIKPANIPKMFTPFFTTKKSGTGLGLSICKKIVEGHGGRIAIAGEPDRGTLVSIELASVPEPG